MSRENFRSRLGFILVSAGCAIGIGNVWNSTSPVSTAAAYSCCSTSSPWSSGVPILTMELAVGRASRKSAVLATRPWSPRDAGTSTAGCA
ncbi:MAG: hypothetical protein ACLTYN_01285 [Dysosmobacter welbionis]